ncbi:metallophosphoesterase [Candidatus Woesearchaeota archaeon]|nr:metallophosphoesterase [Candidatus Woesearchaeota archaeon]
MEREVIIIGDVEIGGGTLTDDFIADRTFSNLIAKLTKQEHPVDLVLNGDTFDFLKCPLIINGKNMFPRHINADISLEKLEMMVHSHPRFFTAIKKFVRKKKNRVYFIIGNHDPDLVFRSVQRQIKKILHSKENVYFSFRYQHAGVYAEHGHQYDFLNKVNKKKLFLMYKKEKILNIPWVSFSLISNFMTMKEEHPFSERIKPWPLLFSHHHLVLRKLNKRSLEYLFKALLYYPIRYFRDPTYWVPTELFRELYRRMKNVHWDVDEVLEKFKRKQRWRRNLQHQIHVLGHVHKWHVEQLQAGTVFIHPDTWRDEYMFDDKTRLLKPKTKRYVRVAIEKDVIKEWEIVEMVSKRKGFKFDDVIKDEFAYISKAAQEEGHRVKVIGIKSNSS